MSQHETTYPCERCGMQEPELHKIDGKFVCPRCAHEINDPPSEEQLRPQPMDRFAIKVVGKVVSWTGIDWDRGFSFTKYGACCKGYGDARP